MEDEKERERESEGGCGDDDVSKNPISAGGWPNTCVDRCGLVVVKVEMRYVLILLQLTIQRMPLAPILSGEQFSTKYA